MIPQSEISTKCREQMALPISMKKRSSNLSHLREEIEHYTSDLLKSANFGTRVQTLGNDLGMTPRQYLCKMETDRREARRLKKGDVRSGATVKCLICGYEGKTIANHLLNMHGLTVDQYKEKFEVDRVSSEDVGFPSGENNPAHGHGGKFSKWSKNFIYGYDADAHERFNLEQSRFQSSNPYNEFRREAYSSGEEYSKAQTRNLDWFVGKFGEEDGTRRHVLKTQRWIGAFESKTEEELNDINSRKVRKSSSFYSRAEKELLGFILQSVPGTGFAKSLKSIFSNRRYVYDIPFGNSISEYDGDFWHANPDKVKIDFVCPYRQMTAKQIWDRDEDKTATAIYHGYKILRVWETDYKKDKAGTVQKCINFLTS